MTERNRTLPAKSRKELKELAFQKSWTLEVLSREIGISYKTLHQGLGGVILAERTLFKIQQFIDKQADVA
jgi:hypothetical protein